MAQINPLEALMFAVSYSVKAGSNQQLADAQTTSLDVGIEQYEYNAFNQRINGPNGYANTVRDDANWLATHNIHDPDYDYYKNKLTADQATLQKEQSKMQTVTQQCNSATQTMQSQAGQDATTMQQKVQLEAAVNQVLQTLASALGQRY